MRATRLFDTLQNLIEFRPTQSQIAKILNVGASAIGNRVQRDADFSEDELNKISAFYGVDLVGDPNCIELDYIHIRPSCGHGTYVIDEADITPVKLGKELIQDIWRVDPQNLKLFKSSGDSMEPSIMDGNILLVDVSKTDFHNGGVFLITINNEWFIKRLRLRVTGELDIISDNSKYPIETLLPNSNVEISVKGKIIKNLSIGSL